MNDKLSMVSPNHLLVVLLCVVLTYAGILLYTRVVGLRSFSKMSAADFAMTVAVGSLFASTISSPDPTLLVGLYALALLFAGQWVVARLRRTSKRFSNLVDNKPLLLMRGPEIIDEHLAKANVTRSDIYAKLREANVLQFEQVRAVIFETTGDISVLHTTSSGTQIDDALLSDVVGWYETSMPLHLPTRVPRK